MRERQLSAILFAVTVASIITLLPIIIYLSAKWIIIDLPPKTISAHFHGRMISVVCLLANSLVNPIIYAMRMQGFRAGVKNLLLTGRRNENIVAFPLPGL